jgi:hypothetical protein
MQSNLHLISAQSNLLELLNRNSGAQILIFAQSLTEKRLMLRQESRHATAVKIIENMHLET